MIIDKKDTTSIITQVKASISEMQKKLQTLYPKFKNDNIVIKLSDSKPVAVDDVNAFLPLSNAHKAHHLSFVIVAHDIDFNNVSDAIIVVPTLQEAFDIIAMEAIERDLGF